MKTIYKVTDNYTGISEEFECSSRQEAKILFGKKYLSHFRGKTFLNVDEFDSYIEQGLSTIYISGDIDNTKYARCTLCGDEFTENEMDNKTSCPSCGTKSLPCLISDDVNIKINWHELRILTMWSENWAKHIDELSERENKESNFLLSIMCIAERLQKQFPDKTKLTLFSEIRELKEELKKENGAKGTVISDLDDDSKLNL